MARKTHMQRRYTFGIETSETIVTIQISHQDPKARLSGEVVRPVH